MLNLLLTYFILLRVTSHLPISYCLHEHKLVQKPLLLSNQCNETCGKLKIPFPFYLNSSCGSVFKAFHLSCKNSTTLFLKVGSESYRVFEFFTDGLLVDFPGSSSCRQYNDLNSFDFTGNTNFGISGENVIGLYDCEDSSLCKAECETIDLPGCDGNRNDSPACCYPLSDHSVWHFWDKFSVFSKFGCRGFSSWVALPAMNSGKRGVKLEWAIPWNSSKDACATNSYVFNTTAIQGGIRCSCQNGFVGDGFVNGKGCIKSCITDRREVYGNDCYRRRHNDKKLVIVAGILASIFIIASLIALYCLLQRPAKLGRFDSDQTHFHSAISLRKACRTRLFTYQELEEATKGFDSGQKLVDCNHGTMYTGVLGDGSRIVVHKIQCETERDLIEVLSQIEVLSAILHQNMARLIGCCIDLAYMPLVVYEDPANGTLEEHLHLHQNKDNRFGMDWYERLKIVSEIASVLAFLHYEISPPIFHRDLKSGCVLIDEDLSSKISGFGLISLSPGDSQYNREGSRFQKNDVYDLGLLLLEIIAGSKRDLETVVLEKIRSGKLEEIVDPLLYSHEQPLYRHEQLEIVADLATRCLLFGGGGKLGMIDVAKELIHVTKGNIDGGSKRRLALEETFSNSSLLQMISMSPDSNYVH